MPTGRVRFAQSGRGDPADFYRSTVGFPTPWRRFLPTDPTSPHWYDEPALKTLVFNHVAATRRDGSPDLLLRDFVLQFRGLTGTAKAKAVCDRLPRIKRLRDFEEDEAAVVDLLRAMRAEAMLPKPKVLGAVGLDHVRACFEARYGVVADRFWYRKVEGMDGGVPFVVEAAVAATKEPGEVFHAVNFSPTFGDPFDGRYLAGEKASGYGALGLLRAAHVLEGPSAAFVHVVCPALTFLDRGKSRLNPPRGLVVAAQGALWGVAKTLHAEGERRRRDAAGARRDRERLEREARRRRWTLKDAAFAVMEQAWAQATDNGRFEARARTVFYQARPLVQRYTDAELKDDYFTQTLLPLYEREARRLPGVYYEARGTLYEPHTGVAVELGTREVEAYRFPLWLYDKILFVEKQGLWPPLKTAQLAERYDMAIAAGEGFATVAARTLLDRADKDRAYRLFVLHDADPGGYNIARTLRDETERMPGYRVEVVDLGLRFEEGLALGLSTETFTRKKELPTGLLPALTTREREAFVGQAQGIWGGEKRSWICERIELNALTSPQLVAYIEAGLEREGATTKVVPDAATIRGEGESMARDATRKALREELQRLLDLDAVVDAVADRWGSDAFAEDLARLTPEAVRAGLDEDRTERWRAVVAAAIDRRIDQSRPRLRSLLEEAFPRRP